MAVKQVILDRPPLYVDSDRRRQFVVTLSGVLAGLVVFALAWFLQRFLIVPLACKVTDASAFICGDQAGLAFALATVITVVMATVVLARQLVYRPLLITLASAITLWGISGYLSGLQLGSIEQALWLMLLYGLSYTLFGWLLRFRHFAAGLLVTIVAIVLLRLMLVVW